MKTLFTNIILLAIVGLFYILKTCGALFLFFGMFMLYTCNKISKTGYIKSKPRRIGNIIPL